MLPRRQSIFHLAEEGGAQRHRRGLVGAAPIGGVREGLVVGLQIIVHDDQHRHRGGGGSGHHHHQQHGRHARAASIVLKQMVRAPPQPSRHAISCSFLKACSLCRMELSPRKDVYMYRGDQGFCSEECRRQQILVDEAREREAIGKERRRLAHHHHRHRGPHHTPIRGRLRKTLLAVA